MSLLARYWGLSTGTSRACSTKLEVFSYLKGKAGLLASPQLLPDACSKFLCGSRCLSSQAGAESSNIRNTFHNRRLFLHSVKRNTIFSNLRSYSSELQPQLSFDLIKIMEKRLLAIEHRSAYLLGLINQPEASQAEYSRANKELRKLRGSMDLIKELRTKEKEIEGLKSLMDESPEDKEMLNMASEELCLAMEEVRRLQNQLLKSLLPKDDADERDCILEVRAGTGGEEASLFAMDIFKMYERYSTKKGWKFDVVEITESDLKGYKEASAAISGADVYGKLKFESGIHRVQRVPVTENLDVFTPVLCLLQSFLRLMRSMSS